MTSSAPGDDVMLDDVVARVRELPTTLRSLYVETDGWSDVTAGRNASSRAQGVLVQPLAIDPGSSRPRTESRARSWMVFDPERWDRPMIGVLPSRRREELEFTEPDGSAKTSVSGRDEDAAWWQARDDRVEQTDARNTNGSMHSSWVASRLWIQDSVGRELVDTATQVLGRLCARVRVTPPGGHWAAGPLHAGDAHLLDVDTETGLTLAVTSFYDGEVFQHHEVVALELDPEIDVALTAPPDGAVPVAGSTSYRDVREVAADAEGLVLLAPTWLPDGYVFGTAGARPMEDGEMHAVLYYRRDGSPTVMISERAAPPVVPDTVEGWTWVERGDRRVMISDVTGAVGVRLAATIVDGTAAHLHAALTADELLDVAFSLEPVRR